MRGDTEILDKRITGDFVWDPTAQDQRLASALAVILTDYLQADLHLQYDTALRDVIACRGTFVLPKSNDGAKYNVVIKHSSPAVGIEIERGNWNMFLNRLSRALNLPSKFLSASRRA